ncbi:hypothetical protein IG631_01414 [Alternaria alternata]|nr:hypothetical protein IG631_01414 [Alternaria alternata]
MFRQWRIVKTTSKAVSKKTRNAPSATSLQLDLLQQCSMHASYVPKRRSLGKRPRPSRRARLGDGVVCQGTSAAYPTHCRIDRRRCLLYFTSALCPGFRQR